MSEASFVVKQGRAQCYFVFHFFLLPLWLFSGTYVTILEQIERMAAVQLDEKALLCCSCL